jgi:hypothetical protein
VDYVLEVCLKRKTEIREFTAVSSHEASTHNNCQSPALACEKLMKKGMSPLSINSQVQVYQARLDLFWSLKCSQSQHRPLIFYIVIRYLVLYQPIEEADMRLVASAVNPFAFAMPSF